VDIIAKLTKPYSLSHNNCFKLAGTWPWPKRLCKKMVCHCFPFYIVFVSNSALSTLS